MASRGPKTASAAIELRVSDYRHEEKRKNKMRVGLGIN
jgi:hypothetical protein